VHRLVRRLGTALVVLTLCRGLGPAFAAAVVLVGGLTAGAARSRALLRRTDLRGWAAAVVVTTVASAAWLAHIGRTFPLPDRPGSGWATALGWLPWYLRQSVGAFGTNDSAVSPAATVGWCVVVLGTAAVGATTLVRGRRPRTAALAGATLAGGLALNVTAEGLSLPPIGFFWQGRYALPLLVGGVVLATVTTVGPDRGFPGRRRATGLGMAAATLLLVVHVHAFAVVAHHHGSPTGAGAWALGAAYTLAIAALALTLVRHPAGAPAASPPPSGSPPPGDPPVGAHR
jgi:hypothetical protein